MSKQEKEPLTDDTVKSPTIVATQPKDITSTTEDNTIKEKAEQDNKQDNLKGRHFWYVVYPESAPENWIDLLKTTGLAFNVSPLHDKDTNPDDSKKKEHYHVIISWGNTTTYKSARALCEILNCPRPQMLRNVKGAYRYAKHKDNPEKYQYIENCQSYNGWTPPLDNGEVTEIKKWIHRAIYFEDIQEYGELITLCSQQGSEYIDVATSNTFYCEKLCSSYRNNPLRGLMRFYNSLDDESEKEYILERIEKIQGKEKKK